MKPHCWWCCYPFEWESLHYPYDFSGNTFYTTGHFCSWECMKAYAINKGDQCEFLTLMKKRMNGKITHTKRAPSKLCLEMFGGTVTIQEFRNGDTCVLKIPGEFYQDQIVTKQDMPVKTEPGELRLKREKPLERTKGKLETSLGIIRKCTPRAVASLGEKLQNKPKDSCGNSQMEQQ